MVNKTAIIMPKLGGMENVAGVLRIRDVVAQRGGVVREPFGSVGEGAKLRWFAGFFLYSFLRKSEINHFSGS
jgi:hypothetical protein